MSNGSYMFSSEKNVHPVGCDCVITMRESLEGHVCNKINEAMTDNIQELVSQRKPLDDGVLEVLTWFEKEVSLGNFSKINDAILNVMNVQMPIEYKLAILSSTYGIKELLTNRESFYNNTKKCLREVKTRQQVKEILKGLK